MTMQGIASITLRTEKTASEKVTKASETSFDSFMNTHTEKVSRSTATKPVNPAEGAEKAEKPENRKELAANQFDKGNSVKLSKENQGDEVKDSVTYQTPEEQILDAEKAAGMAAQVMVLLQELFGLLDVELQDIMSQLSLQPQDLLVQVDTVGITLVNTDAIQSLLLGVHGMEDATAFLTNEELNQELISVTEQISTLLADGFHVAPEDLTKLEPALVSDFAEQMGKWNAKADPGTQTVMNQTEDDSTPIQDGEVMTVVYEEVKTETGSEDGQRQDQTLADEQSTSTDRPLQDEPVSQTAAGAFTENLVKAFGEVRENADISAPAETTMQQIVEQVVRQVRIRVMPETTSMQLQLHPASLGRVALTVATTTVGTATASLVVENQMAKEALESQMIQLKETFAEQGLKVDAVEVTVAEFGFKKENQQQDDPSGNRKQNRRFRSDDEASGEEDAKTEQVTASERRDVNSMVDYTA